MTGSIQEAANKIKDLVEEGKSQKEVAETLGLTVSGVQQIRQRSSEQQ